MRGVTQQKHYCRRNATCESDMVFNEFKNTNRFTMTACINASGETGQTLFVFKGTRFPYV